jgi:hypothetical protein
LVNGCIPSLPAIAQLLLVTAAIFNNSYDHSVWFIDVTIASNNCSANLSNGVILNNTYYISVWSMNLSRQTYWDGKGEELNITKRNIDRE